MNHLRARLSLLLVLYCSFALSDAYASQVVSEHSSLVAPGNVLDFKIDKVSDQPPLVIYGTKEALVMDTRDSWRVLIGIDLNTVSGDYLVYIDTQKEPVNDFQYNFSVSHKNHPVLSNTRKTELLKTKNNSLFSTTPPENLSDIELNNTQEPKFPFFLPVLGTWSDGFGARYEHNETDQHYRKNFISLTTTELVNVMSPQAGIISRIEIAENKQINGAKIAAVTIDHGRGLYSIITGLSDLSVTLGESINEKAVIGKMPTKKEGFSESTIYWQCILNGVFVDPNIFLNF